MRTPRELLLHRHRHAEHELDAIRRRAIEQQCPQRPSTSGFRIRLAAARLWAELIVPYPRAWIGVAAVWVLIMSLHVTQRRPIERAGDTPPLAVSSVESLLEEQVRLRAELLDLGEAMGGGANAEDDLRRFGPRSQHPGPNLNPGSDGAVCLHTPRYPLGSGLRTVQRPGKHRTYET